MPLEQRPKHRGLPPQISTQTRPAPQSKSGGQLPTGSGATQTQPPRTRRAQWQTRLGQKGKLHGSEQSQGGADAASAGRAVAVVSTGAVHVTIAPAPRCRSIRRRLSCFESVLDLRAGYGAA